MGIFSHCLELQGGGKAGAHDNKRRNASHLYKNELAANDELIHPLQGHIMVIEHFTAAA